MSSTNSDILRSFFKRYPKFYYFVGIVFGPMMFCGLSPKKFLTKYCQSGETLNIGSGPRIFGPNVVNVDIHPYGGVDIVADAVSIPVADGSFSGIISDNVFEHLADPGLAVAEMYRILSMGGYAYVCTPFLYPFHSSPNDFQRWTNEGMRELMKDFEIIEIGLRAGPFSTLTVTLCYLFATILSFGSHRLYWLLVNLFMLIFWPIKLFDIVFNYWPGAINMAAVIYCVVKKK
jgi:SAM-dependent methyltransferase